MAGHVRRMNENSLIKRLYESECNGTKKEEWRDQNRGGWITAQEKEL